MVKHAWTVVGLIALSLAWPGKAVPQTASPEALAAAKEFMIASKMGDQVRLMVPAVMQQLKPAIVRGNPKIERDYDALMPDLMKSLDLHMDAFLAAGAQIYARHFTPEEMRQVTAFFGTATGQKFLQKQPEVMQESMALGQRFGEILAKDAFGRMTEELRKRGHNI